MQSTASMSHGEWLTRGTVWLALTLYTGAERVRAGRRKNTAGAARIMNTAGCIVFLAHIACAFTFYHHWSHAAAYSETARQTAQLTGWDWGGGLYINYAFAVVWLAVVIWSWVPPREDESRSWRGRGVVPGFFLFMIFNGTVVFVPGPARWYGLTLCLVLVNCWWRSTRKS